MQIQLKDQQIIIDLSELDARVAGKAWSMTELPLKTMTEGILRMALRIGGIVKDTLDKSPGSNIEVLTAIVLHEINESSLPFEIGKEIGNSIFPQLTGVRKVIEAELEERKKNAGR